MKQIGFETVFGDYLDNPSLQSVKDLFYNRTLKEWDNGNEISTMSYENGSRWSSLNIVTHRDYGFSLLFTNSDGEESVLTEGERTGEVVHVGIGDGALFREQLVSRETAWQAVEHFMQTGERLESLNWQKYEVPDVEFAGVEAQAA